MTDDVIDRVAEEIEEETEEEESALDRMDHASEPDEDEVARAADAGASAREEQSGVAPDGLADARDVVDRPIEDRAAEETEEEESALDRMDRESEPDEDDVASNDGSNGRPQ